MLTPVRLPLPGALAVAAVAGVLSRLAFPAHDWWPLAVVGVALWVLAASGRTWRGGALVGLVYGLAFLVPLLHWSGVYVGTFPWMALSVLESAYFAGLGAALPLVLRLRAPLAAAAVAALWVGQEALRDRTPYGGFPWGRLAFSQADSPFGALAALGGAPLVAFAVALAGALVAVALLRLRQSTASAVGALLSAGLVTGAGLLVPLPTSGTPLRVAGIQGSVPAAGCGRRRRPCAGPPGRAVARERVRPRPVPPGGRPPGDRRRGAGDRRPDAGGRRPAA